MAHCPQATVISLGLLPDRARDGHGGVVVLLGAGLEAACFGPCDPGPEFAQVALADPGCMRLDAAPCHSLAIGGDQALLPRHAGADIIGDRHTVGVAEHLDPAAAVCRAGISEPAHGFFVITERSGVFQSVGHIEQRPCGPGVVPVDESRDVVASPDAVPRAVVPVTDDLPNSAGPRAA